MATVDTVVDGGQAPAVPQPAAPPPPPPGSTPVITADGTPTRRTTRRTVRRRPIPRGTVAISGGAVVGTLLTIVYAAAGPLALVATAVGTVAIPLAVWRRHANSRTGRRSTARRGARRRENGRRGTGGGWTSPRSNRSGGGLGLSNPLAGLGGGGGGGRGRGSRSTGRSLFGAGAGGGRGGRGANPLAGLGLGGSKTSKAGRAASGGMPTSRRKDGSRTVGGRGGRNRQVTPKVGRRTNASGRGPGGRTPKTPRGGGAGGWKPPKGAAPSTPKTTGGKVSAPTKTRGGTGGGWKPPKGATTPKPSTPKPTKTPNPTVPSTSGGSAAPPPVKKVKKNRPTGYGPQGRGGQYGAWTPPRRATRRGRVASAVNHGLWKAGSAFMHGVRRPNGRRAFRAAFRRYGAHGYNPTATGFLGRIAGGLAAAVPASVARLAWILAKKLAISLREAYNPPRPAPAQNQQQATQQNPQPTQQQHPVPNPAFTNPPRPTPGPKPRPNPHPRQPQPQPAPNGGGSNSHGGNAPMSRLFPPHAAAADFFNACVKWSPERDGTAGAIWSLEAALPYMAGSVAMVANGWSNMVYQLETNLQGGLKPGMRSAMSEVFNPLQVAAVKAQELPTTFAKVYATDIARRQTVGGQHTNV